MWERRVSSGRRINGPTFVGALACPTRRPAKTFRSGHITRSFGMSGSWVPSRSEWRLTWSGTKPSRMNPMSSDLDAFLGRGPLTAAPAKEGTNPDIRQTNSDNVEVPLSDQDSAWLKMAVSDPSAWRKKNNPYTNRIAQMIADDSMLPRDGQVGK